MEKKQLKILVISADVVGRVNACAGLTIGLLKRGHRVIFFTESSFSGRMIKLGFEEYVYKLNLSNDKSKELNMKPGEKVASGMFENRVIGPYEPLEKIKNLLKMFLHSPNAKQRLINLNQAIQDALDKVSPDFIVFDNTFLPPAIQYSGIPWLNCISTSPLYCILDNTFQVPPGGSGFDSREIDHEKWTEFNNVRKDFFYSKIFSGYLEEMGYKSYENDIRVPNTAFLTCFAWPDNILPEFIRTERSEWYNVETFNRNWKRIDLKEIVPKDLFYESFNERFNGKWIYLSMGTMGCVDVELMKRLISMLPNDKTDGPIPKILVSLGPKESEIKKYLPLNSYGEQYFKQTEILPNIDLLITHGGNNTVTEGISRGIPMLLLPLFADQYDNAQRLQELGLGIRLDPYKCTEMQFKTAINSLLNDQNIKNSLKNISARIQSDDRHHKLHDSIEFMFCK